jgi:hypothetical protein
MLRVVNPFVGNKAYMAYNPATKKRKRKISTLSRTKRYRKTKRSLAKRGFSTAKGKGGKARMIHFGKKRRSRSGKRNPKRHSRRRNFMEAAITPARSVLPDMRELTAEAQTAVVGAGAFMLSNALGQLVNRGVSMLPTTVTGPMQGVMGLVKFAGRYLGARALSKFVFTKPKGFLSKENGAIVKEIVVITGGLGLMHDFGLVAMLPAGIQSYIPTISGMSALERMGLQKYVHGGTLSKYVRGGTLGAYARGTPRVGISAYKDYGNGRWNKMDPAYAQTLGSANLDNIPLETAEGDWAGIPRGH